MFAALILAYACCPWALDPRALADVQRRYAISRQYLDRYRQTHSLGDLEKSTEALDGTFNLDAVSVDNFVDSRRQFVRAFAPVLAALDAERESAIQQMPKWTTPCPMPPRGTAFDILYPAYCSHTYFTRNDLDWTTKWNDFVVRARAYNERLNSVRAIEQLERLTSLGLEMPLHLLCLISPRGIDADFQALDSILSESGINGDLRVEIISNFCLRPGPRE